MSLPAPHQDCQSDPIRRELIDHTQYLVIAGRYAFFSVLHDIHFHHTADGEDVFWPQDKPAPDLAAEALELLDTMAAAIATARAQITQALDQRAYLLAGRPLLCAGCGSPIETPDLRLCQGWAEHDYCHHEDPELERAERDLTVEEAEWEAHLAEATRRGPRHGDHVLLALPDGSTRDGIWLSRDEGPDLFLPFVTTSHTPDVILRSEGPAAEPVPPHLHAEVTELGQDWADYEGPVRADGSFDAPAIHQALLDLQAVTRDLFPPDLDGDR